MKISESPINQLPTGADRSRTAKSYAFAMAGVGTRVQETLFDAAPRCHSGFLVCDGRGVVALCDDSAAVMLGCRPGEVEGVPLAEFLSDSAGQGIEPARHCAGPGEAKDWWRLQAVDWLGKTFPMDAAATRFSVDGATFYLLHFRHCDDM